jgi:hypothetical protein
MGGSPDAAPVAAPSDPGIQDLWIEDFGGGLGYAPRGARGPAGRPDRKVGNMNCSQCGTQVADGTAVCPQCGAQLASATGAPAAAYAAPPAAAPQGAATGGATGTPAFKFDAKRWTTPERVTLGATFILFISLFLPWFTYNYGIGSVSVDGLWHGWMYLVLLICLAIFAYYILRAGFGELPFKLPIADAQAVLILTAVSAVLTILAFLFKPGGIGFSGIGWGFGAFIGLITAIVACAPSAIPAIKARRAA